MAEIINPHDRFFKNIFSHEEYAREFLENYLPEEIKKLLDLNTLIIFKESFIEKELREYFSDLLYRIDIKRQIAFIYLLFEHKSRPDPLTAFQLLRYMVKIWGLLIKQGQVHTKLPIIIPLVIYHGASAWRIDTRFTGLFCPPDDSLRVYIPDFNYMLYDISHLSDDGIKGAVMLRVSLLVLKYIFTPELKEKLAAIFSLLKDLKSKKTGLEYLETLLRYIINATDKITKEDLQKAIESIPEGGDIMPTIAEQWIEEGYKKGIQQGMQQGIKQGIRQGLLEAIELGLKIKFGAEGLTFYPDISKIRDIDRLRAIKEVVEIAKHVDEIKNFVISP